MKVDYDGESYDTTNILNYDSWNLVVIKYTNRNLIFKVNDIKDDNLGLNLSRNFLSGRESLYIGSNDFGDNNLNGTFKMFSYSKNLINDQTLNSIYLNDAVASLRKYYDKEGRLNHETRYINGNKYNKEYIYYDDNSNYTELPVLVETDKDKTIYTYDELDNITHKVVTDKSDNILKMYYYEYDEFKRLIKEKRYDSNNNLEFSLSYTYDNSGNILSKTNELTNKTYNYHYNNTIKNRLDKITSNNITLSSYTYTNNSFNPSSINKDEVNYNIEYLGSKIIRFGNVSYKYNEQGLRVEKSGGSGIVKYTLSGNNVIKSKDITYRYDEGNKLIGLSYNDREYFYERDLLDNIIKIVDTSGITMVEYEYEAYGKPTILVNSNLSNETHQVANILSNQNIYLYKGYIYDSETKLYYCETRYYDPEYGRWLTIDSFKYLDSSSPNGLNLYAYCLNNPVMYVDPSGTKPKWWQWTLSTISVVAGALLLVVPGTQVAGAALIGGGIGSIAGGYIAEKNGYSFDVGYGIGFGLGAFIGAGIAYAAPLVSEFAKMSFTFQTGIFIGGGNTATIATGITVTGNQIIGSIALGGLYLFAKGSGPRMGHNQHENKQVDHLSKKYRLTKKQRREFHDYITKWGYTFKELEEILIDMFFK